MNWDGKVRHSAAVNMLALLFHVATNAKRKKLLLHKPIALARGHLIAATPRLSSQRRGWERIRITRCHEDEHRYLDWGSQGGRSSCTGPTGTEEPVEIGSQIKGGAAVGSDPAKTASHEPGATQAGELDCGHGR
jgi:hypothetical protein